MSDHLDFEYLIVDSTIVRAHQHAAGAKKGGLKIRRSAARAARYTWPSAAWDALCGLPSREARRAMHRNPRLHVARKSAVEAVKTEADRYAANVLPIIREAQKAGASTLRQIAEALNARGIPTARGGQWYAQSIANILERT
jgi:hypothetical protein